MPPSLVDFLKQNVHKQEAHWISWYFFWPLSKTSVLREIDIFFCQTLYRYELTGLISSSRQFMDSLGLEPESVDNLDMYSHIPPVLMEKCAALSVRPDTVKSLIQSMQGQWQQTHTQTHTQSKQLV